MPEVNYLDYFAMLATPLVDEATTVEQGTEAVMRQPLPVLADEQRRAGHERSLAVRRVRAELKKDLKSGEVTLAEATAWNWVQGMKVLDLLRALPAVGNKKAVKVMQQVGILPTRKLSQVGSLQLERLLAAVEKSAAQKARSAGK